MLSFILPVAFLVWQGLADTDSTLPFTTLEDITAVFILTKQHDLAKDHQNITGLPCKELSNQASTNLTLMNKGLLVFPSCLPKTLEILDLSHNNLSLINISEIVQLSQLQDLAVRHNGIEAFHCPDEHSSSLEVLDISYNRLKSVPACSVLLKLKKLSLAGNPIIRIEPFAFTYFPNLAFLNLSATQLGKAIDGGISESSFALKIKGDSPKIPMTAMNVLDLSETFLPNIQQEWTKNFPNLKELHIAKMAHLHSLDTNALKYLPNLSRLNCQGSRGLSLVRTEIFKDVPQLNYLDLQNCNLSTLNSWSINSSTLNISLYGNPLKCSCKLSWLLSDPTTVVLLRPEKTLCTSRADRGSSSSLSLLELYNECQSNNGSSKPVQPENTTHVNTHSYRASRSLTTAPSMAKTGPTLPVLPFVKSNVQPNNTTTVNTHITVSSLTNAPSTAEAGPTSPRLPFVDSNLQNSGSTIQIDQSTLLYEDITHAPSMKEGEGSVPFPDEPSTRFFMLNNALKTTQIDDSKTNAPAPKPNPSQKSPHDDVPISYVSDDYDYGAAQEEKSTVQSKAMLCDYHPCKHLQRPCLELQSLSRCFCPGLSGENTIPDPPRLRDVSEITDTSALIHWCAPNSVVHKYELIYQAEGSHRTVVDDIYVTARQYTLYGLAPGTTYQVCVVASNKAGSSEPVNESFSRSPCSKLKTKPSYTIILAVLCSTSGILLIAIIILSVCLCKKSKNPQTDQYDTHLVSYKNPAFEHQLKPQTRNTLTE
ncbi:leucine-rich repeat neuronal protein 4 [Microcaecilia unicolor]|uniref:Leucine-rich repeat neuronal protein 4 n=1 Tax=Microcaecilia unicolor TaxID=1415580 RepID=A0A6P7XJQ3_9AMPH|nr:leucine-rich repeat neuronal protein 4 [Microcaecilia unicolor]